MIIAWLIVLLTPLAAWGGEPERLNEGLFGSAQKTYIYSDSLEYSKPSDEVTARGNVRVERGDISLEAGLLNYSRGNGELIVKDNVLVKSPGYSIRATSGRFNLESMQGELADGEILVYKRNYRISGSRLEKGLADTYTVSNASFTTCNCAGGESPLWSFRSRKIKLKLEDRLTASHIYFNIKTLPVFYLPYVSFPVKQERESGFLTPGFKYSKLEGFRLNQELFLVLSPSQDVTLSLDARQKRGTGGKLNYRYVLSRTDSGRFDVDFFNDTLDDKKRWLLKLNHKQSFGSSGVLKANINYLNEVDIFTVQNDDDIEDRVSLNLDSDLFYTHRSDLAVGHLLTRYSRSLVDQSNELTLQKLPEVSYSLLSYRPSRFPVYLSADMSAVNFWSEEKGSRQRVDLNNSLLYDNNHLLPFAMKFSLRDTLYRHGESEKSTNRLVYYFSSDIGTTLFKDYRVIRHVLSPSVQYEYIPKPSVSNLPEVDEIDTISAKNAITISLYSYFLMQDNNSPVMRDLFFVRVYETINLGSGSSDIRAEGVYTGLHNTKIDLEMVYSTREKELVSYNTELDYTYEWAGFFLGSRVQRAGPVSVRGDLYNPISQAGDQEIETGRLARWGFKIDLPAGIKFKNSAYYNMNSRKFLEIKYLVFIPLQCVEIMLSYDDLPRKNQISFLISLKGLGDIDPPGW